jgi:hypothetical protein
VTVREAAPALLLLVVCGCAGSDGPPSPVAPETPAPPAAVKLTRGPYLQWAGDGGVLVAWYQDVAAATRVEWRAEGGAWQEAPGAAGAALRYEAALAGLQPGASYAYRLRSGSSGSLPDASGRSEFAFRTPRSDVARLVFMGDTGSGIPQQHAVAERIAREDPLPDAVTIVGDVIYEHGEAENYDSRFFHPYRSILPAIPFLAAVGNHDYETAQAAPLLAVFTLPRNGPSGVGPENLYWLERAGVLTIVHNTCLSTSTLRDVAVPWHASVARRAAVFRLAVLHHPPYSSGPNAKDPPTPVIKALFPPVFASSGIDLALSGHEHFYERTRPLDGVVYVVTGNGGTNLYPRESTNSWTAVFDNTIWGYTHVEAEGRQLTVRHTATDGRVVDQFTLRKPVAASDPVSLLAARRPGEPPRARAAFRVERPWLVESATLRVLGEGTAAVRLNGVTLAAGVPLRADGFVALDLDPRRLAAGANLLEVEPRRPGAGPRVEVLLVERALP